MDLKGKIVNFLGDSITEGVGASSPEHVYPYLIKEKYGLKAANNYGISGTRFAKQTTPSENPRFDLDFCSRVAEMDPDADIIVVFGGVNDYAHGDAPIGCFEDRTPDTFYGACHTLMRSLIEKYPFATIVFMTPLHTVVEPRNKTGKPIHLCEYVQAIRETAEYYSLPVLDLYAEAGMQPEISIQRQLMMPDGIHPNDVGAERIADRLAAFIKRL